MNIRNHTQQDRICADSRWSLPHKVNSSMDVWNRLANNCNAKVTFIPGVERPVGPFGNWMQTITVTIEGDYDNPKYKELVDALQASNRDRLKKLYEGDFSNISEIDFCEASDNYSDVESKNQTTTQRRVIAVTGSNTNALLKRAFLFLEDGDWNSANDYCETVLDMNPECAEAYLGKLMADLQVHKIKDIANHNHPIEDNANFQKALRFGNEKIKAGLLAYSKNILERLENERLEEIYQKACVEMNVALSEDGQRSAAKMFASIVPYKDSEQKRKLCLERVVFYQEEIARKEEASRREAEATQKKTEARQKKHKKMAIIAVAIICIIIASIIIFDKAISPKIVYKNADALAEAGSYCEAAIMFASLGDYKDASEQSNMIWDQIAWRAPISAGHTHTVGLRADGTVIATNFISKREWYDGQCDVYDWKDIVAISAGVDHTVGLKEDGTVVATNYTGEYYDGQCDVYHWKNIIAISAGDYHTVGLNADGTVVAVGENDYGQCNVENWGNIVAISAGYHHTVALKTDGTAVATKFIGEREWYDGQCGVYDWKDIVAISAGYDHTVGLKADGTVVAVGANDYNQCNVGSWTDIVAISAGSQVTVGLKADGTVVAVGATSSDECNVKNWTDIIAISAGQSHTVGLRADGTVVATKPKQEYYSGECDVTGWTNIKVPQ